MRDQTVWMTRYNELKNYKSKFGDCKVPSKYKENRELGLWVGYQRSYFNDDTLAEDRIHKLDEIRHPGRQ